MNNINSSLNNTNEDLTNSGFHYFPFFNRKQAAFFLFLISLVFYAPSIYNEYSLDDGIIIHQNEFVLKGIRGIKGILTKDLYDSFYRRMNAEDQLQGGRFRPLPVISYAIEQEFIGTYRSGYYMRTEDANKNGVLDEGEVLYTNAAEKIESNYEYNNFIDLNGDQMAQPDECYYCWDLNKNFKNESPEDLNKDGVFNEIDCQVYGAGIRHFNNILFYGLACVLLYLLFSKYLFKQYNDLAFLAALLFVIHPVHSEVVANVRGRDDIFSLIFICLTFIFSFNYFKERNFKNLITSALFLLMALLSKEYAALLFLFVPLAFYVFLKVNLNLKSNLIPFLVFILYAALMAFIDMHSLYYTLPDWQVLGAMSILFLLINMWLFRSFFINQRIGALLICFYVIGIFYLAMRLNAVKMAPGVADTELLNNPFLLASGSEAFATKVFTLLLDLKLLLFPHPLISDYSYASISYRHIGDWDFIMSFLIYLFLFVLAGALTLKRHVIGFALLFYLVFIVVVSNLIIPTGTVMLESYLFHASIGVCIILAWGVLELIHYFNTNLVVKRTVLNSIFIILVLLAGIKCWERSKDWKNDVTLFLKDVKNQPHSVLILGNAGARWIDLADTREITGVTLPGQDSTRFNDYNGTLVISDKEMTDSGYTTKREAALYKGINFLKHAVELHPRYVNGYLNLGLAYFKLQNEIEAIKNWKYAEHLYPNNPYLNNYYYVFSGILKDRGAKDLEENKLTKSLESYKKWALIKPKDAEAWYNLSGVYEKLHDSNLAQKALEKAIALNPNYSHQKNTMNLIPSK